ncbi:GntR family transcriptional regulator [Amycolatopsis sp. NPDC051373]|uniref:GntR family transcriptional regulator n=1 Tax=Amycolatopsis sp. NPDC051373 TaxID=3155801 RepID=UPI00344FD68D
MTSNERGQGKPVPQYMQIAEELRHQIREGVLKVNGPVPSAATLCRQYDVSMITSKKALQVLQSEGLVYSVPGKGTYVADMAVMIRTMPYRHFEQDERTYVREAGRAGRTPTAKHDTTVEAASDWVARRLEIPPGSDVTTTNYKVSADGQPMSMSTSWEPRSITGGTIIEHPHEGPHGTHGLNARFRAIGWTLSQIEERLLVRQPTTIEASELAVPPGVPVMEIRQTVRGTHEGSDDLVPIEAADIIFPTDRYEFVYLMDRPK